MKGCRHTTDGSRCDECKRRGRVSMQRSRDRRGVTKEWECYLCMGTHPKGLRFCRIAAEWDGWPHVFYDAGMTWPESPE
jgi:hypothetical protein